MSDPVANVEIEDVLSSVRRLVAAERKDRDPRPSDPPARPAAAPEHRTSPPSQDRLVLTPALRVTGEAGDGTEDVAARAASVLRAANAAQDRDAQRETPAPFALDTSLRADPAAPPPADVPAAEAWHAEESADAQQTVPGDKARTNAAERRRTMEATIAELEAAVTGQPDDWEPDGSEKAAGAAPDWSIDRVRRAERRRAAAELAEDAEAVAEAPVADPDPDGAGLSDPDPAAAGLAETDDTGAVATDPYTSQTDAADAGTVGTDAAGADAPPMFEHRDYATPSAGRAPAIEDDPWQIGDPDDPDYPTRLVAETAPEDMAAAAPTATEDDPDGLRAFEEMDPGPGADDPYDGSRLFAFPHSAYGSDAAPDTGTTEDAALDAYLEVEETIDEEALRQLVAEIVRQELQGALGERITRNVRKLVRREIYRILNSQDFE